MSQLGVCLEQASKGGRSSRSHWGQVSEEEAQPSPGWASPTRQASGCCWHLGGAKQQGWRGCGGQGPKGTLEAFLLEINCKKTVQIIMQMSPHSGGSWWWHFFAGTAETQLTERRVGWGGDTQYWVGWKGWETSQRKKQPRSGLEGPGGGEGGTRVVQACQRWVKARSCSLGSSVPGKLTRQGTEGAG